MLIMAYKEIYMIIYIDQNESTIIKSADVKILSCGCLISC